MRSKHKINEAVAQVPCFECPLLTCEGLRPLTKGQLDFTWSLKSGELHLERGGQIVVQGSISPHLYTLLSGIAFRFKTMEDGRRQVVNYLFPGDLVGLQGAMDDPLSHGAEALTNVRLCVFPRHRLFEIYEKHPRLAFDISWLAAKEETALDEHLLALGRRKADERIAYLALFLLRRGKQTGLAMENRLDIPLNQTQIADTLGLSLVHTNKTLQSLRRRKILNWQADGVTLLDIERAGALANFDLPDEAGRPFI